MTTSPLTSREEMGPETGAFFDKRGYWTASIFVALSLMLPAFMPEFLSGLVVLIPLPVFYYLTVFGSRRGAAMIRNALLAALAVAALLGQLPELLFSLIFLLLGVVLYRSGQKRGSLTQTLFMSVMLLAGLWFLFWVIYGLTTHTNPYQRMVHLMDQELQTASIYYRETQKLPEETAKVVADGFEELRELVPKILPSLMITGLWTTAALNIFLGNWLLRKKSLELAPWQCFQEWRLPEPLVWGVIVGGVLLLAPLPILASIGTNILLVMGVLYFSQGLAIASYAYDRWPAPRLVRMVMFGILLFHTYGIILVTVVGMVDVWVDFRKPRQGVATS